MGNLPAKSDALPVDAEPPPVDEVLFWPLERALHPHPDIGRQRAFLPEIKAAAARQLAMFEAACQPVSARVFDAWCRPILANVRNPLPGNMLPAKVALLYTAFADYPMIAFTAKTQAAAMRATVYLPAGGDLAPILDVVAKEWIERRDALRYIAEAPDIAEPLVRANVVPVPVQLAQAPVRSVDDQVVELRRR